MKKTLNAVLAVVLAVAMFAGFAYIATPERTNEYQIALTSAKAVTVQDTVLGVRSYADLADATKGFQVNEVIHLAITAEVKNMEKPASNHKYKSIAEKDIKVVVGSPNIDLQYARMSNPTLLAHVWSGYTAQNVATVGYVLYAGNVLEYDKATNEISWEFTGVDLYAMQASGNNLSYNLVTFNPDVKDGKIVIPAVRLKDKETTWVLGQQKFDTTYEAPEAVYYTMVLSGVTKDNAGAAKGEFYAKILISGAEKFVDDGKYYFSNDNKVYTAAPATQKNWKDYVEVKVKVLKIAGGYNVYRYDVPASAVLRRVPIIFGGDYDDFNGTQKYDSDAKRLAYVNTNFWDFATSKTDKTDVNTAGGITEMKRAYATYDATSVSTYPMTSLVYTATKAYYAPGFYGGTHNLGNGNGEIYSTEYAPGKFGKYPTTSTQLRVERWTLELPKTVVDAFQESNVYVMQADKLTAKQDAYDVVNAATAPFPDAANTAGGASRAWDAILATTHYPSLNTDGFFTWGGANGYSHGAVLPATNYNHVKENSLTYRLTNRTEYTTRRIPGTNTVEVVPSTAWSTTNNAIPLGSDASLKGNQWIVFYFDPRFENELATSFSDLYQSDKLLAPGVEAYDSTGGAIPLGIAKTIPPAIVDRFAGGGQSAIAVATINANHDTFANSIDILMVDDGNIAATPSTIQGATTAAPLRTGTWGAPGNATAAMIQKMNTAMADLELFWPTFEEHTTDLPIADANAPGISFGALVEQGSGEYSTSKVPAINVDLDYLSQIQEALIWGEYGRAGAARNVPPITTSQDFMKVAIAGTPSAADYFAGGVATGFWAKDAKIVMRADGFRDIVLSNFMISNGTDWSSVNEAWFKANGYRDGYTWLKLSLDTGKTGTEIIWNSAKAAPENVWDTIEYHNGIVVYTITNSSTDRPYISLATERSTYESEDGFGIALFDGYNADKNQAARIYRSNDSNLSYSVAATGGHVNESASMISALKYFGLDTSFGTTFRVFDSNFTSKGAPAVYSENVTGTFQYGNLEIIGETIDEGTDDVEVVDPEETEVPEVETPDIDGPEIEDPDVDVDVTPTPEVVVVRTGNASANIAIALVASAIVAAAGLAFVMKKRVH